MLKTSLMLAALGAVSIPAVAEVTCEAWSQTCIVIAETAAESRSAPVQTNRADSERRCAITRTSTEVPCHSNHFGAFNDADECYYKPLAPQPDAAEPIWAGRYPAGIIYSVNCIDPLPFGGTNGGWVWLPSPPPGLGVTTVTPAQLAQRAVDEMTLTGPSIHLTIDPDETGLVGIPVWLWTDVTPSTWGPNTATASVPGLAVTATARATSIEWDMGDGHTKVCDNPGTPYFAGGVESPTCDYVYETSSAGQPGDAYPVTATTTWQVDWSGGGTSGSMTLTRTSTTTVRIGELQVLITA